MEITLEQLLQGKATRIKKTEFQETAAYVEPFIERMHKFTDNFIIQASLPDQLTLESSEEDVTYNRVLIQAVMPTEPFENHKEVIGFLYGLDVKQPIVKIYKGGLNMACTNLCVFNPEFLNIQELSTEKAISYKPVDYLLEKTDDTALFLKQLSETEFERDPKILEENLGKWVRNSIHQNLDLGFGKVKLSPDYAIKAYKSMFIDDNSPYYIQEDGKVDMFTVYNAFTDLICNDKGKDLLTKTEKVLLLRQIFGF